MLIINCATVPGVDEIGHNSTIVAQQYRRLRTLGSPRILKT